MHSVLFNQNLQVCLPKGRTRAMDETNMQKGQQSIN